MLIETLVSRSLILAMKATTTAIAKVYYNLRQWAMLLFFDNDSVIYFRHENI